jgi:transposase
MQKGFDGLFGLVQNELGHNPMDGEIFVFLNKPRNTIKLLHWEYDGLVFYRKRLEKGNFPLPRLETGKSHIKWPELVLMLEGIKAVSLVWKPRFSDIQSSKIT